MASVRNKSSVKQQIDENLKRVFDEALKEELPDKFMELIDRLNEKDAAQDAK